MVIDLINSNIKKWRKDVIISTFTIVDATKILQVLLAMVPQEDVMVWRGKFSGVFSVKSTYKIIQIGPHTPILDEIQNASRLFYRQLWSLNLPSKIKITIWRLSKSYLPTLSNLYARRLVANERCVRCANSDETIFYVFRD